MPLCCIVFKLLKGGIYFLHITRATINIFGEPDGVVYSETGAGTLDSSVEKRYLDIILSGLCLPFKKYEQGLRKQDELKASLISFLKSALFK